jgi:hypothetical protein
VDLDFRAKVLDTALTVWGSEFGVFDSGFGVV